MGYYATGHIQVLAPVTAQAAIALDSERIRANEMLESGLFYAEEVHPDCDFLTQLLIAVGFNIASAERIDGVDEATRYYGDFSDKWWSTTEDVLGLLASHGCAISCTLTGEDGQSWGYTSALGGAALETDTVTHVLDGELARLRLNSQSIEHIRILAADPTVDDATVRAAVLQNL